MNIIDGKKIRDTILEEIQKEVSLLPFVPVFCDVVVGQDPASLQYVNIKMRYAEKVGIKFHKAFFPESIKEEDLLKEIGKLNNIENMCGIIVQLPLPKHLNTKNILDSIDPKLDVDCLGSEASKQFYAGKNKGRSLPTALACLYLLDSLGLDLKEKKIVVLGQGNLVGKPVARLLEARGLKVERIVSDTENKEKIIKDADILISGIGKGKYLKGEMLKEGVVLIDAGTSESFERTSTGETNTGIVGDVDLDSVKNIASFVSPVPGGVGPVTVAMLLRNVLEVAKK